MAAFWVLVVIPILLWLFFRFFRRQPKVCFNFGGIVDEDNVVKIRNGIPQLNLHMLRVREAIKVTQMFLKQCRGRYRRLRIITGRGLHSPDGLPKIKPAVQELLKSQGYIFSEVANGGCFEVQLKLCK